MYPSQNVFKMSTVRPDWWLQQQSNGEVFFMRFVIIFNKILCMYVCMYVCRLYFSSMRRHYNVSASQVTVLLRLRWKSNSNCS